MHVRRCACAAYICCVWKMERVVETGKAVLGVTEGLIAWQHSTRYATLVPTEAVNRACGCVRVCVCGWRGVFFWGRVNIPAAILLNLLASSQGWFS